MSVYVRSIRDGSKIRLRAIEGQKYSVDKNVQGSREIRHNNPIGSIFVCAALENAGSYYRAVGGLSITDHVPFQHDPTVSKTKRTKVKEKDTAVNVLEFV